MNDFSDYTSTMPRFSDTDSAVRFQAKRLRPFARNLATLIRQARLTTFPIHNATDQDLVDDATIGRIADA